MTSRLEVSRGWARWTARAFRIRYPQYETYLYENAGRYFLYSNVPEEELAVIQKIVHEQIRPMTCPLGLVNLVPVDGVLLDDTQSYEKELWLNDAPLSVPDLNRLLGLVDPTLPIGGIDYSFDHDSWLFKSFEPLSGGQRDQLRVAMKTLGIETDVQFETVNRPSGEAPTVTHSAGPLDLALATSRSAQLAPQVRQLLARDEDEWRDFLKQRSAHAPLQASIDERGECLFDAADKSDVRLSELLTLYERINLIPDHTDSHWLRRHGIGLAELQELVALGRCRLVLPFSADRYSPELLAVVAEVDSDALILSRSLAKRVVIAGQTKDPLLYGPFTNSQRAQILSLLHKETPGGGSHQKILGQSYSTVLKNQHYGFMMNGAAVCLGSGIGAYLGELIFQLRGQDARLELGVAGASVEWAIGLGAALIPRSFGGGYDETGNCHSVASFISRTRAKPVDPVAQRMHTLVDGLLAVADIPALEVARNFRGGSAQRFHSFAARLMRQAPTSDSMREAVEQINVETQKFERRRERLRKWRLDTAAVAIAAKPVGDAIDANFGSYASVGASILYEHLAAHAPKRLGDVLREIAAIMQGLMMGPSLDAVIVSRSRSRLLSKQ